MVQSTRAEVKGSCFRPRNVLTLGQQPPLTNRPPCQALLQFALENCPFHPGLAHTLPPSLHGLALCPGQEFPLGRPLGSGPGRALLSWACRPGGCMPDLGLKDPSVGIL